MKSGWKRMFIWNASIRDQFRATDFWVALEKNSKNSNYIEFLGNTHKFIGNVRIMKFLCISPSIFFIYVSFGRIHFYLEYTIDWFLNSLTQMQSERMFCSSWTATKQRNANRVDAIPMQTLSTSQNGNSTTFNLIVIQRNTHAEFECHQCVCGHA